MCYCPTPTLHLNLALTGDGAFLLSLKKTYSVWFISVLNYGDTENVLINHLLLVIPMSYPCHYTNLCPHKPHKHAHTHTHTHTHSHTHTHTHTHIVSAFAWGQGKWNISRLPLEEFGCQFLPVELLTTASFIKHPPLAEIINHHKRINVTNGCWISEGLNLVE